MKNRFKKFITSGESSGPQTARRAESGDQAKYETPWLCPSSTYTSSYWKRVSTHFFHGEEWMGTYAYVAILPDAGIQIRDIQRLPTTPFSLVLRK
jgi:hypothetical protein